MELKKSSWFIKWDHIKLAEFCSRASDMLPKSNQLLPRLWVISFCWCWQKPWAAAEIVPQDPCTQILLSVTGWFIFKHNDQKSKPTPSDIPSLCWILKTKPDSSKNCEKWSHYILQKLMAEEECFMPWQISVTLAGWLPFERRGWFSQRDDLSTRNQSLSLHMEKALQSLTSQSLTSSYLKILGTVQC